MTAPEILRIEDDTGDALVASDDGCLPRSLLVSIEDAEYGDLTVILFEGSVRKVHDRLGVWLAEVELQRRALATVIAEHEGAKLLRSAGGEWGVLAIDEDGSPLIEPRWGDEAAARRMFASCGGVAPTGEAVPA